MRSTILPSEFNLKTLTMIDYLPVEPRLYHLVRNLIKNCFEKDINNSET